MLLRFWEDKRKKLICNRTCDIFRERSFLCLINLKATNILTLIVQRLYTDDSYIKCKGNCFFSVIKLYTTGKWYEIHIFHKVVA
jgi:hypothetical protein